MMTPRSNRFAGMCQCGTQVPAGKGALTRRKGRYAVLCSNCTPMPTEAMERDRLKARAGEAAEHAYDRFMRMGSAQAMRVAFEALREEARKEAKKTARMWARENIACTCTPVLHAGDFAPTHAQDCAKIDWRVENCGQWGYRVRMVSTGEVVYSVVPKEHNTGEARAWWKREQARLWEAVQTHA